MTETQTVIYGITPIELYAAIETIVEKKLKDNSLQSVKLYYVHQVAKLLGKSDKFVNVRIDNGIIKANKDRQISEQSLREYLQTGKDKFDLNEKLNEILGGE